jgi:hypothetical protein
MKDKVLYFEYESDDYNERMVYAYVAVMRSSHDEES